MQTMTLILLSLLTIGVTTDEVGSDTLNILDPRCTNKDSWNVDDFTTAKKEMVIWKMLYEKEGRIVCKDTDTELPALSERDNWLELINFIRNLETTARLEFPYFYERAFTALGNMGIRKNCTAVLDFCSEYELGCPHVNERAYSSRTEMVRWATDSLFIKEGRCQMDWTRENINRSLSRNESWILDVKATCESCWNTTCASEARQQFHDHLLAELRMAGPGNEHRAFIKLCHFPVVMRLFTAESLHLERRFCFYDAWLQLMLAFQQVSDEVVVIIIMWSIACVTFFNVPSKFRDLFDPYIASARKELKDRVLNWLKSNLASKPQRKKTRRANKKKPQKGKKWNQKRNLPADAQIVKLPNGKYIIERRGPCGRGGRRKN